MGLSFSCPCGSCAVLDDKVHRGSQQPAKPGSELLHANPLFNPTSNQLIGILPDEEVATRPSTSCVALGHGVSFPSSDAECNATEMRTSQQAFQVLSGTVNELAKQTKREGKEMPSSSSESSLSRLSPATEGSAKELTRWKTALSQGDSLPLPPPAQHCSSAEHTSRPACSSSSRMGIPVFKEATVKEGTSARQHVTSQTAPCRKAVHSANASEHPPLSQGYNRQLSTPGKTVHSTCNAQSSTSSAAATPCKAQQHDSLAHKTMRASSSKTLLKKLRASFGGSKKKLVETIPAEAEHHYSPRPYQTYSGVGPMGMQDPTTKAVLSAEPVWKACRSAGVPGHDEAESSKPPVTPVVRSALKPPLPSGHARRHVCKTQSEVSAFYYASMISQMSSEYDKEVKARTASIDAGRASTSAQSTLVKAYEAHILRVVLVLALIFSILAALTRMRGLA